MLAQIQCTGALTWLVTLMKTSEYFSSAQYAKKSMLELTLVTHSALSSRVPLNWLLTLSFFPFFWLAFVNIKLVLMP